MKKRENLNKDKEFRKNITSEEDIKKQINLAVEEAIKRKMIKIVTNMDMDNYSIFEIARATGLSVEEVERIQIEEIE